MNDHTLAFPVDTSRTDHPPVDNTSPCEDSTLNQDILPIWYWCVSFVLVLLFVGGISWWEKTFQGHAEDPSAEAYNIERLKSPTENLRIVTIGDSYTRYALPFDERLEKIASEKGLSIKYNQFTKNKGKPRHFSVLLPHVLAAKPDYVFIHAGPFLTGSWATEKSLLTYFRNGIRDIKNILLGRVLRDRQLFLYNSEGLAETIFEVELKPEVAEMELNQKKRALIVLEPKMPEAFKKFFKAAKAQGTRIVFMDLGPSTALKAVLSSEFNKQVASNLIKLGASHNIDIWSFPSLPLNHFEDVAHLNSKGSRVFVDWFLGRLMDEVKKDD